MLNKTFSVGNRVLGKAGVGRIKKIDGAIAIIRLDNGDQHAHEFVKSLEHIPDLKIGSAVYVESEEKGKKLKIKGKVLKIRDNLRVTVKFDGALDEVEIDIRKLTSFTEPGANSEPTTARGWRRLAKKQKEGGYTDRYLHCVAMAEECAKKGE